MAKKTKRQTSAAKLTVEQRVFWRDLLTEGVPPEAVAAFEARLTTYLDRYKRGLLATLKRPFRPHRSQGRRP